ncbi:MAG: enoyl-CoA hydratase-related protein [Hyphomicrobiaceae bacterium]
MTQHQPTAAAEGFTTRRHGKILIVTLDRPKANAINNAMSRAMYRVFDGFQNDPDLVVAILASANARIFSGGWDLKEVANAEWQPGDDLDPEKGPGPGGFGGLAENWTLDKPVIAAVNGAAVGGGFELALACDIIIASDDTFFQLPELMRGFLPDVGGMQRLHKLIPPKAATEMLLTGRRVGVEEAQAWGLVAKVVPKSELLSTCITVAETIAEGAPLAIQALKAVTRRNASLSVEESFARAVPGQSGIPVYEQMLSSEDFLEGPRAFAEKRKPNWTGR